MKKVLTNKFLLLIAIFALFFFFGSITNTLTLNNRAIVVGIALDQKDDKVQIACQSLVAGQSGSDKVSNNTYAVTQAEGRTLGEAIQKIVVDSAEFVSFAHCNSIIIGKDMANSGNLYEALEELLLNSKIMENTSLVYYDGTASDVLLEKIGINLMTSFAVQRMISANEDYYDTVKCTIKDYLSGVRDGGGAVILPEVKEGIKVEESSQEEKSGEKKVLLSLRTGACLNKTSVVGLLSDEEVISYNFVKKQFKDGMISVKAGENYEGMEFENKTSSISCKIEKGAPIAECKIELTLADMKYVNGYDRDQTVVSLVEKEYSAKIKSDVESLYQRFATLDVDVFGLYQTFYAKFGKSFKSAYPVYSGLIPFTVQAKVKVGE